MTIERMIELLNIEHECILRNINGNCDRDCDVCDLVQDDADLDEMYTGVIDILKTHEPRVMTSQDFDENPMKDQYGNLPCWLESREPLVASNWCRWNEDDFIRPMMRNFRPWTSRPTDEQRKATSWNR